jgi:hypothetical protein
VLAAAAEPGQPFGAPQLVSPLGTRTDRIVAALADDGRRMIAWRGNAADASAPLRLAVAFGDATADVPAGADRASPRIRLLDARERGGKLRARLRSDEPVAVRAFVGETARGQAVAVPANRATTLVWSLTRYQRGKPPLIVAADAAGNVRTLRP